MNIKGDKVKNYYGSESMIKDKDQFFIDDDYQKIMERCLRDVQEILGYTTNSAIQDDIRQGNQAITSMIDTMFIQRCKRE